MPKKVIVAAWVLALGIGAAALVAWPVQVPAQDAKADAKADAKPAAAAPETEAEKKEREGRRACAVDVCATLYNRKPADGQVACSVQKTWRKEVLTNILKKGKVSWPWGDTRCSSDIKLDRAVLIKAMAEPNFEAQFDTYAIRCDIDNDKDKYQVTLEVRPKVTFKDGKAVKAAMNWGKIEAPTLAKTALWPITAADNTFGLLQSMAVEDINEFIATKCMEVKEEWQGK
jgi:hypothetical protein